jgi:hypothetical protein
MSYLNQLQKVTEEDLSRFIAGKTMPAEFIRQPRPPEPAPRPSIPGKQEFQILEHVDKVRKVGRNYVTRCRGCDNRSHLNLCTPPIEIPLAALL